MAGAILNVFSCSEGAAVATELNGKVRPVCDNGQGAYVEVDTSNFESSYELDPDVLVFAVGACVLFWATGIGVGMIIKLIKSTRF